MIYNTNKKLPTIVIDNKEDDDWIRSLPGAESERKIMDEILAEIKSKGKGKEKGAKEK